jgi:hypothetical protein
MCLYVLVHVDESVVSEDGTHMSCWPTRGVVAMLILMLTSHMPTMHNYHHFLVYFSFPARSVACVNTLLMC